MTSIVRSGCLVAGVIWALGASAIAADVPAKAPLIRTVAADGWSGAYIGAQSGYGFGRAHWPTFDPSGRFGAGGWIAGGLIGANVRAGPFVVGAESEWLWSGTSGGSRTIQFDSPATLTTDLASRVTWLSLNSLRAGIVLAERWLAYGKVGVAFARATHSHGFAVSVPNVGGLAIATSGSAVHTGWLGGAGVEYALPGNWSARLEYNYLNFRLQDVLATGLVAVNFPPTVETVGTAETLRVRHEMHLVKFGISYRFGSIANVIAARY